MNAGSVVLLGSAHTAAPSQRRRGFVRAVGRQWVDDVGAWYPFGGTLMWALRGVRDDLARLKRNQQFLAHSGCDYQRILGYVAWPGQDIDWRWAITEDILGFFLDYSFNEFGLRTSMSLLGDNLPDHDAIEMSSRFAAVVASRKQTILDVDCANEASVNRIALTTLKRMALTLRERGLVNILSLTDAEHSGLNWNEVRGGALQVMGANSMTSHPDRDPREDGCRFMRQPYDCRDLAHTIHCEEPIGPGSSVAECYDPLQLAMLRAIALCHGEGAFILHNGAGVYGIPNRNRPANLWETQNIDAIMRAVKNVDKIMPPDVGSGRHYNNQLENPFRVVTIWPEAQHGANRRYTVDFDWGFICPSFGIAEQLDEHGAVVAEAEYVCRRACTVDAFDPVLGTIVQTATVAAGATVRLHISTRDTAGHGGLIVRGTYL